jgi:predicted anti-sigma-YlaC factor YlaD
MNCEREFDVLDAVMSGRWPDGCDADLQTHARTCAVCADLVEVAHAVRSEHLADMHDIVVPPSGVVWWKAQRRARHEAVAAAQRALTAVQTGTIAVAIVIGLAIIGGVGALATRLNVIDFDWLHVLKPSMDVMILAGILTAMVLTPIAVWLVVHED